MSFKMLLFNIALITSIFGGSCKNKENVEPVSPKIIHNSNPLTELEKAYEKFVKTQFGPYNQLREKAIQNFNDAFENVIGSPQ